MNMLTLILIILIALTILCFITDWEWIGSILIICSLCPLIIIICLCVSVFTAHTIDEKIAMYEEENSKIETDISDIVSNYMSWEANTYRDFKVESPITLVPCIPELNSDELVKEQIRVYTENNKEIRRLKESKINLSEKKWLLYFGH